MSIARCPACLTAFRVGDDVLGRRGGRVRCGHCYRPFNALEHLVAEPEESTPATSADDGLDFEIPERFGPPRSTAEPDYGAVTARAPSEADASDFGTGDPATEEDPQTPPTPTWKAVTPARARANERNPFAASGFTRRIEEDDRVEPSLDGEPDLPPPATASIAAIDASMDADDDSLDNWRAQAYGEEPQPRRWAWALGVGMLLGTLVAQASFIYREPITREWPRLRPVYLQVCERLGCEVPLPRVLERFNVASTRLDPLPDTSRGFVLIAEIANLADHPQQLPYLELSLQDHDDRPVARRAFAPQEWLPADTDTHAGIAAGERLNVALPFETAEQARPAGFRVNLFYP